MDDGYSWSDLRGGAAYRLPGSEHIGWWAAVAMLVSILLHVAAFFAMDRMKIALHFEAAREVNTKPVNVRPMDVLPIEAEQSASPEKLITPPKESAELLEEVELLKALPKNQEIDIKPDIKEAEYALQMQNPAAKGDPQALAMEISAGLDVDSDLQKLGREPERIKPAEAGQVTVDPGAALLDEGNLGKFTEDLIKRGANGKVDKGSLDGMATLDSLLDLPPNLLLGKKTMLPSDLLFEFNSADLRESAKVGLMKLALLIDRNPALYCWIEGHTDLVGSDEFNLDLSIRRSEAVKRYLTQSLRMDGSKISTRGFGRYQPLVKQGGADEQAVNRRVEIRMRQTPAPKDALRSTPPKAVVPDEASPPKKAFEVPPPPRALLVKPQRALPVDEEPAPLRATPVEDAEPVIEEAPVVPRARPVAE